MKVELLAPDVAPDETRPPADASAFASALGSVATQLQHATTAEDAFSNGEGSLQAAMYERARADVALSVATATAGRLAQAVNSLLNMQV